MLVNFFFTETSDAWCYKWCPFIRELTVYKNCCVSRSQYGVINIIWSLCMCKCNCVFLPENFIQHKHHYTDTEVASESVYINGELILSRLNSKKVSIRAFFPQGQSKLSAIMRCPWSGVWLCYFKILVLVMQL